MNVWRRFVTNISIKCAQCEKKTFIWRITLITWDGECSFKDCKIQFTICLKCHIYTKNDAYTLNEFYDKVRRDHKLDHHTQVNLV